MERDKIKRSMTNIKPNEDQIKRIEDIRNYYKKVIDGLYCNCKDSRELNIAITSLEDSLMWAVKSIVLEGD